MPNPDSSGWMSLMLGAPFEPQRATSVEEIPAIRAGYDLSHNHVDMPPLADLRTDVVLWEGDGRRLTAEVYVPEGEGPFPVLVYFHGGGFCVADAFSVRRPVTRLAAGAEFIAVNVDYALAPENPFPTAVTDAVYACRWAVREAAALGGDPNRIFVSGDSAGANLSAVCIHELHGDTVTVDGRDLADVDVTISGALLYWGLFDFPSAIMNPGSNRTSGDVWWYQAYLGVTWLDHHESPLVSPLRSPYLDRFPPTYLTVGSEDSLVDQTLDMASALCAANVSTTVSVVPDVDHAFHYVEHKIPGTVTPEIERNIAWLRSVAADSRTVR